MPTFFENLHRRKLLLTVAMVRLVIYLPNAATQAPAPASVVPRQPEFLRTQSRQQGSSRSGLAARLIQAMAKQPFDNWGCVWQGFSAHAWAVGKT